MTNPAIEFAERLVFLDKQKEITFWMALNIVTPVIHEGTISKEEKRIAVIELDEEDKKYFRNKLVKKLQREKETVLNGTALAYDTVIENLLGHKQ